MNALDLTGMIKGLMVVIAIAMSLGKLDDLKRWAAHEAFGVLSQSNLSRGEFIPNISHIK